MKLVCFLILLQGRCLNVTTKLQLVFNKIICGTAPKSSEKSNQAVSPHAAQFRCLRFYFCFVSSSFSCPLLPINYPEAFACAPCFRAIWFPLRFIFCRLWFYYLGVYNWSLFLLLFYPISHSPLFCFNSCPYITAFFHFSAHDKCLLRRLIAGSLHLTENQMRPEVVAQYQSHFLPSPNTRIAFLSKVERNYSCAVFATQ